VWSSRAVSAPIPCEEPVTRAVRPERSMAMLIGLHSGLLTFEFLRDAQIVKTDHNHGKHGRIKQK
jgi:hypothetical protein